MTLEKLKKCRICLAENVLLNLVSNKNEQEIYEKLTDVPFVTEDKRPMLTCSLCYCNLKQCYQFRSKCLEAEELLAQMLSDNYETKPSVNYGLLECSREFPMAPTIRLKTVDEPCPTVRIKVKEEFIIEPKEENQSETELEPENPEGTYQGVVDIPPHHSESDVEDDVPLMKFKIDVKVEEAVSSELTRPTVVKKENLNTQKAKLEDAITSEKTKNDSKVRITKPTSKPGKYFKELKKCDQRSLRSKRNIAKSNRQHIGEKPHKCDVCQRSFSQTAQLTRHSRIHTGEKPYKCDVCQRSFSVKSSLTRRRRIHTGEKPYKCNFCQRCFRDHGVLSSHIRVHTGEKPFNCNVCQRSFRKKGNLTDHMRQHTGEKPYKCDVCNTSFRYKHILTQHIRKHTGENPYKCDICQNSFRYKRNLTKHIREHTGEKPYSKCDVCQGSFIKKGHSS